MRAYLFVGNLMVFANRCPTKRINVQWDLKQCATLYCFLFLCVPNGLNGLIARA